MPTSKRRYESPRLVQYGDLVTLTTGNFSCGNGVKPLGAGDDLAAISAANSPFVCLP
jgi:hypothetical protein